MAKMTSVLLFTTIFFAGGASGFAPVSSRGRSTDFRIGFSSSDAARDLLNQDLQEAMLRRANEEETLLGTPKDLLAPRLKAGPAKSGTGFGGGRGASAAERLAEKQAKVVRRDGVLRVDNVLSAETADILREYLLDQQTVVDAATDGNPRLCRTYYGIETTRKNRCDLHLSLARGGFVPSSAAPDHPLADALQEILGKEGTLRPIYENLVTLDGEFYELAAIITKPGSIRQKIHPDLPFQKEAPLYVIFLALQDVTPEMGPTTFLIKTHTDEAIRTFRGDNGEDAQEKQLTKSDCRIATLKKGDAVLFDARILHAGSANHEDLGRTRTMLNFSFRNPKVQGDIGYKGSMMPGYTGAMTLGTVGEALLSYEQGHTNDPFAKYGDGV